MRPRGPPPTSERRLKRSRPTTRVQDNVPRQRPRQIALFRAQRRPSLRAAHGSYPVGSELAPESTGASARGPRTLRPALASRIPANGACDPTHRPALLLLAAPPPRFPPP